MKKYVLHITNDYAGSSVYKNLISNLDELNILQIIFTPIREKSLINKNEIIFANNYSKIIYSPILNSISDRIFYFHKINKILEDIESKINFRDIKLIHAHTWYSDGGVAYLIHKKYKIPYIITVRNTDLNVFQKYLFYARSFGRSILANSKEIILISASYKDRLLNQKSLTNISTQINKKLHIIPNGVDEFWIRNAVFDKRESLNGPIHCLFVGKFAKGKNVLPLQLAINNLNKKEHKIFLHLIGGGGSHHENVLEQVSFNPRSMKYYGKIVDRSELLEFYQKSNIFTMPSSHETFGLVYVEAMLQGLPILYTKSEGIDGFYNESIGERVTSSKVSEIEEKLLTLINNYDSYEIPTKKMVKSHDWNIIALKYKLIYESL